MTTPQITPSPFRYLVIISLIKTIVFL